MSDRTRDRSNAIAKVVAAARSIVTYQVGLPVGVARLSRALYWLRAFESVDYPVFEEYRNAVLALPTGSERLDWDYQVLREKDKELEKVNARFRDRVFESSHELLVRFGEEADEVRRRDRTGDKPRT